jgi:hypothetical protein
MSMKCTVYGLGVQLTPNLFKFRPLLVILKGH